MKQTIKMNERELNRLISESVYRVLNEEIDEGALSRLKGIKDTIGKGFSLGRRSSDTSSTKNMENFNEMGKPFSGLKNKLKGAVSGFRQGADKMGRDSESYNNLKNNFNAIGGEYNNLKNNFNAIGGERRLNNYNTNVHNNHHNQRMFALVNDLEQDIEQDVPRFNLDATTVQQSLNYVNKDINQNPKKYGIQYGKNPSNKPMTKAQANYMFDDMMDGYSNPHVRKYDPAAVPASESYRRPMDKLISESVNKTIKKLLR